MNYTVFAGCSYTAGSGFELEKNEHKLHPGIQSNNLYVEQFSKRLEQLL